MSQAYPIGPKDIENYKVVVKPKIDWENEWVGDGKTYTYEYEWIGTEEPPTPEDPTPDNPTPEDPTPEKPTPENPTPNPEQPIPGQPDQGGAKPSVPNQNQQGSGQQTTTNNGKVPQTGDAAPIVPVAAAMLVSLSTAVFLFKKKK